MSSKSASLFDRAIMGPAITEAFVKLDPRAQLRNPVMLITLAGAVLTFEQLFTARGPFAYGLQIALWLLFTVVFANFAESVAEGRGKAQARALRASRQQLVARRQTRPGTFESVDAAQLRRDDVVSVRQGEIIPGDGDVIEGIASVDESAITGESAPVIREAGGDRCAVTGGTRILSDQLVIRITANPGEGFLDHMISLVEGATRKRTPNEIALTILLSALTFIFLLVIITLRPFGSHAGVAFTLTTLIALLVCLIPTTIGGLLSAIGIAGMDRLLQRNVLAMSGRAVEAAGDIDVLLLDKTGTITLGNRMASEFIPAPGVAVELLADAAQLASLADETPEGRSIVVLAKEKFALRGREVAIPPATFVPFTAQTRMSGVDIAADRTHPARTIRKGAAASVKAWIESQHGLYPPAVGDAVDAVSRQGGTPLVVADGPVVLGVVHLKDVVKGGIKERFAELRRMGIRTVMITGDNPLTAAAIAAEAGVDDFLAQATPEMKLARIREEQAKGHLVAMTGDGTNDAPALAQADVGVAMNTGTQAAKEAGNMVDLDSNPTKLIEIVAIGKQLLITRGALTTFSIANDVAKYFAIIPAMLVGAFPAIAPLNIMRLGSPLSAILSAVIFNALIIIALIPLALRGVAYRPIGAAAMLQRNLFIYGLGGIVIPFLGIKAIDVLLNALHFV
ncbi:MAG TPA: potassium-transporting ATPase subunit KdpB [Candidatus Didemnitutus sp.]|nr:potassium-transporting ATPase subunit KdpB [Candidatus Didemnitutus sp.]